MSDDNEAADRRQPTGIDGLDRVLGGGLVPGGMYVVHGPPGTGKTILANQACARTARDGARALYVSLLAESFATMLGNLRRLTFYQGPHVAEGIRYVSGLPALDEGGFGGFLAMLRGEITRLDARLLVVDSLGPLREATGSDLAFKRRLMDLQTLAMLSRCTAVLLGMSPDGPGDVLARQIADGVIELRDDERDVRSERSLIVRKFRGGVSLEGRHAFRIDDDGLRVFPRLETIVNQCAAASLATTDDGLVPTGVADLDRMLGGGLPAGTITGVFGGPGSGKTTLGIQFVGNGTPDAPALVFGFFETPARLYRSARGIGIDLEALERAGALHFSWQPQGEHLVDELAQRLLDAVARIRPQRVLVDGYDALVEASLHPQRMTRFSTALSLALRDLGATVMMSSERRQGSGLDVIPPMHSASPVFDNLIVMRTVDDGTRLARVLSIAKIRGRAFDRTGYEFEITPAGLALGKPWHGEVPRAPGG